MHVHPWDPPNKQYPPPKPGEPSLHRAAREGDHASIRRLIQGGAPIDAFFDISLDPGAQNWLATPLMVAAGSGDGATVETVRLLLSLGADPHIEIVGESAATFACHGLGWNYRPGGDAERLRLLLDAGSLVPLSGPHAVRLVANVADIGDPERLALLLRLGAPATPDWSPSTGQESLSKVLKAVPHEQHEFVRQHFEDHIVSAPWPNELPLFQAAASGSVECVRLLLEAGATLHQRDNANETALWHASGEPMVKFLVARGLSLEDRNRFGWTPLMSNVHSPERVSALIAAGADINATNDRGYTVFMHAAGSSERNANVLRILAAAGAKPLAVSALGFNAFHAAIDVNGEANEEQSVRSTMTTLKELGVDMNHRNSAGYSPLARAIVDGTAIEVRVLCELGADVNATCPESKCRPDGCSSAESPVLFAAIAAAVDPDSKLEAILNARALLEIRDADGRTPLAFAKAMLTEVEAYELGDFKEHRLLQAKRCIELLQC